MGASRKTDAHVSTLSRTQERIVSYIDRVVDKQEYLKSKQIAKDIEGLSATQVGTNMPAISRRCEEFEIEKWGYSTGTTWMVTRVDS